MKTRKGLIAVGLLAAVSTAALAAGNYLTYPIVGSPSFCASNNPNSPSVGGITGQQGPANCVQTVPAGPSVLTGSELIPADTGLVNPATVTIPSSLLIRAINRLVGGDFTTNLWQRGTTPVSNATPTVATMAADRWWVISPAGTVDVLKSTPANTAADFVGNQGFLSFMEVRRHTGSTGALTCVGQTLDAAASAPLLGNNAVLSFTGYAPSTYSATNGQVTVSIAYFTAADAAATQAAIGDAGGNGSTFALSAAAQASGITGYQAATAGISVGAGTVASGVATIALTATPTRYAVYAPIPVNNSAGTAVTGVGISICGTFVATSAVTTDFFELAGVQLEANSSAATTSLPNGVTSPRGFEKRIPQDEALFQYAYSYIVTESKSAKTMRGMCVDSTTSLAECQINFPVAMRIAPAAQYTAGFTVCTTVACTTGGGMSVCSANATGASFASAIAANEALVSCTATTVGAAGSAAIMADLGTGSSTGVMSFSAEP